MMKSNLFVHNDLHKLQLLMVEVLVFPRALIYQKLKPHKTKVEKSSSLSQGENF